MPSADSTDRASGPSARVPKVVYLSSAASAGGGELALTRMIEALGPRVDAHVILAETGPNVERLRDSGATVEVLALRESARSVPRQQSFASLEMAGALGLTGIYAARTARRLRELAPDLVHTNSLKAGCYGVSAARAVRIPSIWHLRDRIAADYLPLRVAAPLRQLILRLPNAVIANSRATLKTLGGEHAPGAELRRVIPSPIPAVPASQRRRATSALTPLRVGMAGRIAPWKGQDVFIRGFARTFPTGPERATIIGSPLHGETDERYARELRLLVEALGVADRVEFLGFRADMAAELAQLDILVHASTIPEPFGQVIAEAQAAGLPVIAAAAGGAIEIVEHGRTGLLYPPGDHAALSAALRRLAADAKLRAELARAGLDSVQQFAPPRIAGAVLSLYSDLLATRSCVGRG